MADCPHCARGISELFDVLSHIEIFVYIHTKLFSLILASIFSTLRAEHLGCLPFTEANRSVYGLGKWYAKFRTGKFSSGIAFTICTDQFHLTENGREGLKLVSKMALRKWNTNFRLEYFVRKNRTTFSDVLLLPEIFRWEDPKSGVPFTFEPHFPENSCKW